MILRSRKQSGVVGQVQASHQFRNELICRQAAKKAILWRNDHIEPSCRRRNEMLPHKTVQRQFGCVSGNTERLARFAGREVITSGSGKVGNIIFGAYAFFIRFHMHKVSNFDTLCNLNVKLYHYGLETAPYTATTVSVSPAARALI